MKILNRLSFKQQLFVFFSIGTMVMLGVTSYIQFSVAEKILREKQIEQGIKISQNFASQSVLALLFDSKANAQDYVDAILEFPDVVAIEIFRTDASRLLFEGQDRYKNNKPVKKLNQPSLSDENNYSWYFVAPVIQPSEEDSPFDDVYASNKLLGYIRLTFTKESLNRSAQEHLISNALVNVVMAAIFMLLLMWFTTRITTPIRNLVEAMRRVEEGERDIQADVTGASDVQKIVSAFNEMIATREEEEEQIKKARDLALEAAKIKGEFTSNVSHELRTPMSGILGMLDILRDSGDLNPKQMEYLEVIYTSSNSLLDLINDILDFTRMESGKLSIEGEDFYLIDIIQNVIDLLSGQAHRKDIELGLVTDNSLPDLVHGDSNRIRQVLINLVGNAIKFTDEGHVIIRLELIDENQDKPTYRISVEDTGMGIKPELMEKVYEPFTQIDTSTARKHAGSGLGLTISRQIVDMLSGEIGVTSEEGKGSTFWFSIPFEAAQQEPKFNIEKHRSEVAGLRVLVVDESIINRHAIGSILDNWGVFKQTAPSGSTALTKLKQAANKTMPFDFVVIDFQMKSMHYEEFITHIKRENDLSKTRIVMAINANQLGRTEAMNKGVDAVIEKPVRDIKFYQCITSIMNSKSITEYNEPHQQELLPMHRRILVVEDTTTNIIVVKEILSILGCYVDIANNGQDAIDNYFNNPYDLIFMDCRMPLVDGFEATQIYRSLEPESQHTPIIAMTANIAKDNEEQCFESGMDDYLSKPLSIESVKNMLIKWANKADTQVDSKYPLEKIENDSKLVTPGADLSLTHSINVLSYNRLVESIGASAVIRMAVALKEELISSLDSLSQAIETHDRKEIVELAHSLKGSSQNFGADLFSSLAKDIEHMAMTESIEILSDKIIRLRENGYILQQELKSIIDNEPNSKILNEFRYNVLIVEDNPTELIKLTNSLNSKNINVITASNGTEAIEICKEGLPDLVLLDAIMPEKSNPAMDGFVACRMIKKMPGAKGTPVLIITALDDELSVDKAMKAGASDFISKPVNLKVLQKRAKQLLTASQSERQLKKIAYTDALTELPNRAYFIDKLSSLIRNSDEEKFNAIIFLGLNDFKAINDALSHEIGDALLQSVAKRLKAASSNNVSLARTGGDEFSIIYQNMKNLAEIEDFVRNVRFEITQPFYIQRETINVSASLGISIYPLNGTNLSQLMKRADTAMYYAKKSNKEYLFFDSSMEERATRRLKTLSLLHQAIHNDQLVLHYQPQLSVSNQKIESCEALVRWDLPGHGIIPPNEFIPYAEESGLIMDLGEWVLLNACLQLKQWEKNGFKDIKMAVNLSGRQLELPDLADRVAEILNQTSVKAENLELELTESSLITNKDQCKESLQQLRSMGIDIAIDDFGTGFNTFSNLEMFRVDTVKLDQQFTQKIENESGAAMISAMVILAKDLDYNIVAEGVETKVQKEYLESIGVNFLQGFHLGKPMSAAIFEQSILRRNKHYMPQAELVIPFTKHSKRK